MLNSENDSYETSTQFWDDYNQSWLKKAIQRNDIIVLAMESTDKYLYRFNKATNEIELTGFGAEYNYLKRKGMFLIQ